MRFVHLYSNKSDVFVPIVFNRGLNVIVGRITKPKDSGKDSHNLGKSLFAKLIDFCLLKEINKHHFLKKHLDRFKDFEFYLEIELNSGKFLTVRRPVTANTKIAMWLADSPQGNLSGLPLDQWPIKPASITAAKEQLNNLLGFDCIDHYDYRKGVSYFLRSQDDYRNVFQLEKFSGGRHSEWKPFMAMLLGYSESIVRKKYEVDDAIETEQAFAARYAAQSGTRADSFDKIRGLLNIKRQELSQLEEALSAFDIHRRDSGLNEELVSDLERRTSEINDRLYSIDYELSEIEHALEKRLAFDLEKLKRVFEEARLVLPTTMLRPYEELTAFHRAITEDRNNRLSQRRDELSKERVGLESDLQGISTRRTEILSILREEDWFKRMNHIQSDVAKASGEISRLEAQLETVNQLEEVRKTIESLEESKIKLVGQLRDEIVQSNPTFEAIRKRYNEIFRAVFSVPALLSVSLNGEGNLEFEATPVQDDSLLLATSEGQGNTYKKVLCAAFDLALLETYRVQSFYRFVYHDGIFESLDDRKKLNLLRLVRESCKSFDLQYMMSLIDSDIPRSPTGRRVEFLDNEVILELHDDGDDGRLFKMPKF